MSLKQECIDMMNLIIDSSKDDTTDYSLEVDSFRDICGLKGEDITYGGCEYCEHDGNCSYKQTHKVDVSFWDYGDCWVNYIFAKKPDNPCKGITYIRSRKKLLNQMRKVKNELDAYQKWCAEFGEKYSDYMEYAKEFADELKERYSDNEKRSMFVEVNTDILPIVFHVDYKKNHDWNSKIFTSGNMCLYGNQNIINIFCSMDNEESVKERIRHEIIHYFLYICDMKYKDDDAIFHILCYENNAGAYLDMTDNEQLLFDKWEVATGKLNCLLEHHDIEQKSYDSNRFIMLFAIGDKEEKSEAYEYGMKLLEVINRKEKGVA